MYQQLTTQVFTRFMQHIFPENQMLTFFERKQHVANADEYRLPRYQCIIEHFALDINVHLLCLFTKMK